MKEFITVQCCRGGEWRKTSSERAARNVENDAVETIKSEGEREREREGVRERARFASRRVNIYICN